jgi:hypothetical protein
LLIRLPAKAGAKFDDTQHPKAPQHESSHEPLRRLDLARSQARAIPLSVGKFLSQFTESVAPNFGGTTVANRHQYFCFFPRTPVATRNSNPVRSLAAQVYVRSKTFLREERG